MTKASNQIPPPATKQIIHRRLHKIRQMTHRIEGMIEVNSMTQDQRDDCDFWLDQALDDLEIAFRDVPKPF